MKHFWNNQEKNTSRLMLLAPTGFFKLVTIVYVDIPRYFLRVSNSPINWSLYNYAAKQEERKKEKDLAWLSTIHKAFVRFIYLFFFRGRGKACGLVPFLVAWLDDVAALTGGHLTSQLRFFNHNRKRERERERGPCLSLETPMFLTAHGICALHVQLEISIKTF